MEVFTQNTKDVHVNTVSRAWRPDQSRRRHGYSGTNGCEGPGAEYSPQACCLIRTAARQPNRSTIPVQQRLLSASIFPIYMENKTRYGGGKLQRRLSPVHFTYASHYK